MGENSKIEWTDHTFNPWWGCTHVHAGCDHCYAETFAKRTGKAQWGDGGTRMLTGPSNWAKPLKWNHDAEQAGVRARVFCASMADVFEDWRGDIATHSGGRLSINPDGEQYITALDQRMPSGSRAATLDDIRRDLFRLIDATPHLNWLLLTKRPENILRMTPAVRISSQQQADDRNERGEMYRRNVWLGTSISDQATADKMVPELLKCGDLSPVLFLSGEPLLGPIDLVNLPDYCEEPGWHFDALRFWRWLSARPSDKRKADWRAARPAIDWVIVGGESGHHAGPMHPQWARDLRDQCQAAGVPFFFKQWGEWLPFNSAQEIPDAPDRTPVCCVKTDGRSFSPYSYAEHAPCHEMVRVGKKAAGRLLDGREHNELPEVAHA